MRTSSLALCYSVAEYCAPVWFHSAHAKLVDVQLNDSMRLISGTLRPTPLPWFPALCNTEPPVLRRKAATDKLLQKVSQNQHWPLHDDIFHPPHMRLKSRKPLWSDMQPVDIIHCWRQDWNTTSVVNNNLVSDPTVHVPGFNLSRVQWCTLNWFRTGHPASRSGACPHLICMPVVMWRRCLTSWNRVLPTNWCPPPSLC